MKTFTEAISEYVRYYRTGIDYSKHCTWSDGFKDIDQNTLTDELINNIYTTSYNTQLNEHNEIWKRGDYLFELLLDRVFMNIYAGIKISIKSKNTKNLNINLIEQSKKLVRATEKFLSDTNGKCTSMNMVVYNTRKEMLFLCNSLTDSSVNTDKDLYNMQFVGQKIITGGTINDLLSELLTVGAFRLKIVHSIKDIILNSNVEFTGINYLTYLQACTAHWDILNKNQQGMLVYKIANEISSNELETDKFKTGHLAFDSSLVSLMNLYHLDLKPTLDMVFQILNIEPKNKEYVSKIEF